MDTIFCRGAAFPQKTTNEVLEITSKLPPSSMTEYANVRDSAWRFLLSNEIKELPVDMDSVCSNSNYVLLDYKSDQGMVDSLFSVIPYKDYNGVSRLVQNHFFIAVNGETTEHRQRFTIAHEIGHLIMKHAEKSDKQVNFEKEANMFAARLLMPMCVIKECGATAPEKISELCGVSLEAATYRAERLEELTTRNKFYTSPLERRVVEMFRQFIQTRT